MNLEQVRYRRSFLDAHAQRAAYWLSNHEAAERRRLNPERLPAGGFRRIWDSNVSNLPMTLDEISEVVGVTRERVRQIEAKALKKLRHPTRTKFLRDFPDRGHEDATRTNPQARRRAHLDELDSRGCIRRLVW